MNIVVTIVRGVYDTELRVPRLELDYALKMADKMLYVQFRDRVITYDQLRARGAKLNNIGDYVVLDDFREALGERLEKLNTVEWKNEYKN